MKIIMLCKDDDWSGKAAVLAKAMFDDLLVLPGRRGVPLPETVGSHVADTLISFLSPWVVPENTLRRYATAINFHPASREFPGIGCYNFALYDGAKEYGAICHHMVPIVDTGPIIREIRFPVFVRDSVETLKLRTMATMLGLFHEIMCCLAMGHTLPRGNADWTRRPYTRKELETLRVITPDMTDSEIARRVKATTYPRAPGPIVRLGSAEFALAVPDRAPLA